MRKKQGIRFWNEGEINFLITERDDLNELFKFNNTVENRKIPELTEKVEEKLAECMRQKRADI